MRRRLAFAAAALALLPADAVLAQQPAPAAPKAAQPAPGSPAKPAAKPEEKDRDLAKATEPMKFARVRSSDPNCGATCPEWISAEGRIMQGVTASQLKRAVLGLGDKKAPIFIHSAGGSVEEAYAMARFIRSKGLAVSVTKTDLVECARDDKDCKALAAKGIRLGAPKLPLSVCASSCVFVLAGGVERHVGPYSLVGVHQYESRVTQVQVLQRYRMVPHPRTGEMVKEIISEEKVASKTIKTKTSNEVYDKSEAFFRELGVTNAIMTPLRATPHASMHWLTPAEINASKIATDRKNGIQVIGRQPQYSEVDRARVDLARQLEMNAAAAAAARAAAMPALAAAPPIASAPSVSSRTLPPGLADVPSYDPAIVRAIQSELKAGNCLGGGVGGVWGERSKRAVRKFAEAASLSVDGATPNGALLDTIRKTVADKKQVCAQPED